MDNEYQGLYKEFKGFKEITLLSPLKTLLIYGDSIGYRFYHSIIKQTPEFCKNGTFSSCTLVYTWTYKHYDPIEFRADIYNHTGDDFNETKFLNEIQDSLTTTDIFNRDSVFVINFGIHIVSTVSLDRAFALFLRFLDLVKSLKEKRKDGVFPLLIWKTTTPTILENAKIKNKTCNRFITKHVSRVPLPPRDFHALTKGAN